MAKYIIDVPEMKSCVECPLWRAYGVDMDEFECAIDESIDSWDFKNHETETHKDCPLKKVEK